MSRLIAVDHGSRRIGLAVGDTETGVAFPRPALRLGGQRAVVAIANLAQDEGIAAVVVGLPLNMDGSEGRQAAAARAFGASLADLGLEVTFADERLTSWDAARRMGTGGHGRNRESGALDSAAATLILQEYLDARRPPAGDAKE